MIDHVTLDVSDVKRSVSFYERALAPLGYEVVLQLGDFHLLGPAGRPRLGLRPGDPPGRAHIAFESPDRTTVGACYEAAVAAGGTDNGAPGLREHYHPTYYAAYVWDPDGNNVEVVCQKPE